jgi:DNA-binding NtrC family response regulator
MAQLWIVHRDPLWRDALRRMVGEIEALVGAPTDTARFDAAAAPRAIVLGLAGDFEAELAFAHRFASRGAATWALLARERDRAEVERLFDDLGATVVPLANDAATLRARIARALARRDRPTLAARGRRDLLARRVALWTDDLDLPALLAATDPARAALPVLIAGERGTGRTLLAAYLHDATGGPRDAWIALGGGGDLEASLARAAQTAAAGGTTTICVEDLDRLDGGAQATLRAWVERGAPIARARLRWMATVDPTARDAVDPALLHALAGHEIELPPLRARPAALDALLEATGRRFTDAARAHLRAHPWPGNLRELDAVLRRTIAARATDPIDADDLRFERAVLALDDLGFAPVETLRLDELPERPPAVATPVDTPALRHLTAAVAHEVGNPLVGIRTYASLLPGHWDDAEFRAQFAERVGEDTRRIEGVLEALAQLGGMGEPAREAIDVSALVASLLERHRAQIRDRGLVVLEELDRTRPLARGDAHQLRFAFDRLFDAALAWVPPRGDFYVATRSRDAARLVIELRMRGSGDGLGFGDQSLAAAIARAVVTAHGGSFVVAAAPSGDTRIEIELPAAD